jgi:hypothetical protein
MNCSFYRRMTASPTRAVALSGPMRVGQCLFANVMLSDSFSYQPCGATHNFKLQCFDLRITKLSSYNNYDYYPLHEETL